jgi:hypothetical protein
MIYQNTQLYTKNGSIDDSIKNEIKVGIGVLYKIEVYFPPGCCGLTRIRLMLNERQIYPLPVNEFFRGENTTITFDDTLIIDQPPYTIVIEGFNEDTVYDHLTIVRIGFESEPSYMTRYIPPSITELVEKLQEDEAIKRKTVNETILQNLKILVKRGD